MGLEEPGLDKLIRAGYELLAPDHLFHRRAEGNARLDHRARHQGAAGRRRHPHRFRARLHPRPDDRLQGLSSRSAAKLPAKEAGKARDEGKEYVVQDGDVLLFKFNT